MNNFYSQMGSLTGQGIINTLQNISHQRVEDFQRKNQRQALSQFFPENVSELILSLPEKDRWAAIQALAPEYAQDNPGAVNQSGLEALQQQSQLGPQGPQSVDQQLAQAMTAKNLNQMPLGEQIQRPITGQQAPRASEKGRLGKAFGKQTNLSAKQQEAITKKVEAADQLLKIADRMEELHASGKVLEGRWGTWQRRLGPLGIWQPNDETSEFESLGSEAAVIEAGLISGQTTNEKLKAAERIKPNITQTKKAQLARINAMRKKAESVLKQYGSSSEIIPSKQSVPEQQLNQLPAASEAQGRTFRRGNKIVRSENVNGQWIWRAV